MPAVLKHSHSPAFQTQVVRQNDPTD